MSAALRTSVIIPSYDSARFVPEAIRSALDQTTPALEILVVDDGSGDDTANILRQFEGRIRVIRHPENRGLAAARNTGIRAASGDLVGLLDADDAWMPEMIEAQTAEFAHYPDLGLCFTSLVDCDESLRPRSAPRPYRRRRSEQVFEELYMSAFPMPPSTAFVRRQVFDSAGFFDETMLQKQDFECWLRIAMQHPVSCLAIPLCRRRVHQASITSDPDVKRHLDYEARCFELCARAAASRGIRLPMPAAERQVLSQRRRLREYLRWGDLKAAAVYRDVLAEKGRLGAADRVLIAGFSAVAWARGPLAGR